MKTNNLKKLEDLLNQEGQGEVIRDCCDFILRFLLGQVDYCYNTLEKYLPDSMTEQKKRAYLLNFSINLQKRVTITNRHINPELLLKNCPGWQHKTVTTLTREGELVYDGLRIGELLLCTWDDCWDIDCWETRKGFCAMDHKNKDNTIKPHGNRPKLKLNKENNKERR